VKFTHEAIITVQQGYYRGAVNSQCFMSVPVVV